MKTEIARDSHQPKKRYSGVYQQQGRMLTDADWNELVEILKERLNESLKDVVGSKEGSIGGTPRHRALKIIDDGVIKIHPGHVYVNGVAAEFPGDTNITYNAQADFPSPPALSDPYVLYADIWERTVTHLMDEHLRDKGLHGADTCSRKQIMAQVKGCSNTIDPEQPEENPPKGDAELTVTLLAKTTQPDPCDPCVSQLDVESTIGNFLFRVEVHDVKGNVNNPSDITLKWSSENGAEQFKAMATKEEMPVGFIDNKYVYEFFNETSEKHLGVHFVTETGFPVRDYLRKDYPTTVPGDLEFVRRWDGYASFKWSTVDLQWNLHEGISEGIDLTESSSSTKAEKVLQLDSVELKQQLLNRIISEPVTSDSLVEADGVIGATLVINEIDIGSANPSAKEKAVAINTASTSVTAAANTVLQGLAPSEKGIIDAGQLKVNGDDVVLASEPDNVNAQTDAVVNAINTQFLSDADFAASISPAGAIVLTATDGRNIVVEVDNDDVSRRCGFETGTNTFYGRITIFSPLNSAITIAGDNPEYAGFVAGTTPAVQFVAGDYWLAEVREAEHTAGSVLIENRVPQGIEHRYLTLGEVVGGVLQANPEVDRKYAFPPLTEMTRMFHVGGDGQEAMPGHLVPQPLKVGVTNGEWPVAGARVEFRVARGEGILEAHPEFSPPDNFIAVDQKSGEIKTDEKGMGKCLWRLGTAGSIADQSGIEQTGQEHLESFLIIGTSTSGDLTGFPGLDLSSETETNRSLTVSIDGAAPVVFDLGATNFVDLAAVASAIGGIPGLTCAVVENNLVLTSNTHTSTSAVVINSGIGVAPTLKLGVSPNDHGGVEQTGQEYLDNILKIGTSTSGDLAGVTPLNCLTDTATYPDTESRSLGGSIDGNDFTAFDLGETDFVDLAAIAGAIDGIAGLTCTAVGDTLVLTSDTNELTSSVVIDSDFGIAPTLKLGDSRRKQRVVVRLLNPNYDPTDPESEKYLDHPSVQFYANLSTADQIAYVNPDCSQDTPSVNSLLQKDSVDNGVFSWPELDKDGDTTVKDVLDALLCKIRARHIPYDATNVTRWTDVNREEDPSAALPETVQDAIDDLLENLHSEDITYKPGCTAETLPSVRSKLEISNTTYSRVHKILDKLLCDFNATHLPIDKTDNELCARLKVNEVETVQDALDTLCREGDVKWHNKHLHGWGVVCGLKVKCHGEREKVEVAPGYALDCNGLGLRLNKEDDTRVFDLVANAEEQGLLDGDGNGAVCLWIDHNEDGQVQINIEEHTPQSFFDSVLEGSLIKDFFDDCILSLITFIKAQFPSSLDDDLPLTEAHHRVTALINLLAQSINSASGQFVFLSSEEDKLLRDFYDALKAFIASETFCAMFDNDTSFPDYSLDEGLDTIFGPPLKMHNRLRLHPSGKLAYSYGLNNKIYVYDLTARKFAQTLTFPDSDNIDIKDVAFTPDSWNTPDGTKLYAVALLDDGNTVFATATIQGDNSHIWSPTTIINGLELVSLAVSPAFPNTLYAIGKSQGLFIIDPTAISRTPGAADVPFNATGLLTLSTDGARLFAALNQSIATETSTMTHIRDIDLKNINDKPVLYRIDGNDEANDIAFYGDIVYLTGHKDVNPDERVLVGYDITTGNPAFPQVPLEDATVTRLEVLGAAATNVGIHRIEATGTGLRAVEAAAAGIPASRVAFTATTIVGSRGSAAITYAAADNARTIADVINAKKASTGVSAEAATRARLSALSAPGTVTFDLAAEGATARSISANIANTADMQDLADAINAQSATTNVSAVNNGATLDLFNPNGDDITIDNFQVGASGGGETFTVTALNFDGTVATAETTNLAVNAAKATRITGQVRLDSSQDFSISGGDATVLPAGGSTLTSVGTVDIGTAAGGEGYLLVALTDKYKLMRFDLDANTLETDFRIPAQHYPIDIAIGSNSSEAYVLNMVSNTLTEINVAVVFDSGAPPDYTEEPPTISNVLSIYNQDAYDAYSDLVSHLLEYIKDRFCDKFLIDCPVCTGEEKIYLGAAEIRNGEVYNICNFTKRHYVKSCPTWSYWLSTIPILPLLKRGFASFCCSTTKLQR